MIFIRFIGGYGGSTAGGMKVLRVMIFARQGVHKLHAPCFRTTLSPLEKETFLPEIRYQKLIQPV